MQNFFKNVKEAQKWALQHCLTWYPDIATAGLQDTDAPAHHTVPASIHAQAAVIFLMVKINILLKLRNVVPYNILPRHTCVLHCCVYVPFPSHSAPPFWAGTVIFLFRSWVPPPQLTVQLVHTLHSDHSQLTATIGKDVKKDAIHKKEHWTYKKWSTIQRCHSFFLVCNTSLVKM